MGNPHSHCQHFFTEMVNIPSKNYPVYDMQCYKPPVYLKDDNTTTPHVRGYVNPPFPKNGHVTQKLCEC